MLRTANSLLTPKSPVLDLDRRVRRLSAHNLARAGAVADLFTQIVQHGALLAVIGGSAILSLSHRRLDFIGVFSAGDDEAYALVGRGREQFRRDLRHCSA